KTNVCCAGESGIDVPQCFLGAGAWPARISWLSHHSRIDPKKSPAQKGRRRKNNVGRAGRNEDTGQIPLLKESPAFAELVCCPRTERRQIPACPLCFFCFSWSAGKCGKGVQSELRPCTRDSTRCVGERGKRKMPGRFAEGPRHPGPSL